MVTTSFAIWSGKHYYLREIRSEAPQRQEFSFLHSSAVPCIFQKYIAYVLGPFKTFISSFSLIFFSFPYKQSLELHQHRSEFLCLTRRGSSTMITLAQAAGSQAEVNSRGSTLAISRLLSRDVKHNLQQTEAQRTGV